LGKQRSLSPSQQSGEGGTIGGNTPKRSDSLKGRRKTPPNIVTGPAGGSGSAGAGSDDNASLPSVELSRKEIQRRISNRRAKSFRHHPSLRQGSFKVPTCPITGLSPAQRRVISGKWREMGTATILDMGRNIFYTCFRRDPRLLKVLGLERYMDSTAKWRNHVKFRLHLQRFCALLNEVVKALEEPKYICDQIREFGAGYAHVYDVVVYTARSDGESEKENELGSPTSPIGSGGGSMSASTHSSPVAMKKPPSVPDQYWDTLLFSINNAAKDLQVEHGARVKSGSDVSWICSGVKVGKVKGGEKK